MIRNQITYDTLTEWMNLSPLVCAFMEQLMDGFRQKILWLNVSALNKDPAVISIYFLKFPSWQSWYGVSKIVLLLVCRGFSYAETLELLNLFVGTKKCLATISVMKTQQNIQESGDIVGNKRNRIKGHGTAYLTSLKSKICNINYDLQKNKVHPIGNRQKQGGPPPARVFCQHALFFTQKCT